MTERTLPERLRHCAKEVLPRAMIPLMREAADALDAKSALLAEAVMALEQFVQKYEKGENHNEGAFDADCPVCIQLRDIRPILAKLKAALSG